MLSLTRGLAAVFRPEIPPPRDAVVARSYGEDRAAHIIGEFSDLRPGPYMRARSHLAAELRACRCWIEGVRPPDGFRSIRIDELFYAPPGPRPLRARHDAALQQGH